MILIVFSFSWSKIESRYGVYEDKVRIVFDLSRERDFKVFTLENPRRIVVDIYGEKKVGRIKVPKGIKVRVGKHRWGTRIVLYYGEMFSLKAFALKRPFRIVLDIIKEENEIYEEILKIVKEAESRKKDEQVAKKEDPIRDLILKVKSQPFIFRDRVIVIDPGHGGKDPGAVGWGGVKEKDVNLAIAKKVAQFLKRDGRFKVILTRKGDYFVPLHKRAKIALMNRADLLISIHSDAAPRKNPRARGTQVFALSYKRAMEKKYQILRNRSYARLVLGDAARINTPVVKKVLADFAIDVTLRESVLFGRILAKELRSVLGNEVYFKGINRAGFAVLKTPGIPSVLVETGFITNPREAKKLKNPEFQRRVAWAIYRAIVRYFYGEDFGQKLVSLN